MKNKIEEAIALRKKNEPKAALQILKDLLPAFPHDPDLNYQIAWTYDSMGEEADAVFFYEAAIANGLENDREGALLGLGSTYRCLGEYQKSLKTFDLAIGEFPENRAFKVFRALTLYNLEKFEDSVSSLLLQLLDTTDDPTIQSYDRALRFYAAQISE